MVTYNACGVSASLATAALSETITPNLKVRKGAIAAKQAAEAASKVKVSTSNVLPEKRVVFPNDERAFGLNWLGETAFYMVEVGNGLFQSGGKDGVEDSLNSRALVLHLQVTDRTFQNGFATDSVHLKIDVLFNGQLASCILIRKHDITNGDKSYHEFFAGTRVDFLAERPWVILAPGANADGSLRDKKKGVNVQARWDQVCAALMEEMDARGVNNIGERQPSAQYLQHLAGMPMPAQVEGMQQPYGRSFGVIDVVVTAGIGKKTNGRVPYLKTPMRLADHRFRFKATTRWGDFDEDEGDDYQDEDNVFLEEPVPLTLDRDADSNPDYVPDTSIRVPLRSLKRSKSASRRTRTQGPGVGVQLSSSIEPFGLFTPHLPSPVSSPAPRRSAIVPNLQQTIRQHESHDFIRHDIQAEKLLRDTYKLLQISEFEPGNASTSPVREIPMLVPQPPAFQHYDMFGHQQDDISSLGLIPSSAHVPDSGYYSNSNTEVQTPLQHTSLTPNTEGDNMFHRFFRWAGNDCNSPENHQRQQMEYPIVEADQFATEHSHIDQQSLLSQPMQFHEDSQERIYIKNPYDYTSSDSMIEYGVRSQPIELIRTTNPNAMSSPTRISSHEYYGQTVAPFGVSSQFPVQATHQYTEYPDYGVYPEPMSVIRDQRAFSASESCSSNISRNWSPSKLGPTEARSSESFRDATKGSSPQSHIGRSLHYPGYCGRPPYSAGKAGLIQIVSAPLDQPEYVFDNESPLVQYSKRTLERPVRSTSAADMVHHLNQISDGPPPPPIGFFSVTATPSKGPPPKLTVHKSYEHSESQEDCSRIPVKRLTITMGSGNIVVDCKWAVPQQVVVKERQLSEDSWKSSAHPGRGSVENLHLSAAVANQRTRSSWMDDDPFVDTVLSSELSSATSSPERASPAKAIVVPNKVGPVRERTKAASSAKEKQKEELRRPAGRVPRSPDRLRTTNNPPLNQNCVIAYAENDDPSKGVLRQIKSERQGDFQEDTVVVGFRFFISG